MSDLANTPVYPVELYVDGSGCQTGTNSYMATGITLRQHYAGLAMQGICSTELHGANWVKDTAKLAVKQADALIAALTQSQTAKE